ncbi:ferritin family protein [Ancylomarina sp. 16SWW S1-10-2]|uniref:ferritin family protein n=1 Tax=Ancylomarina sp. 16SWW S1-10-2 TaxID=2499681 RepID=UPI0012ADB4C8|nr:ferritin family protein [Ancylomarina sp. 16SWW S1-10-2]MRT92612.1 rubrerythrin [Ancylomarina sp. 16SWW S1-10-2]
MKEFKSINDILDFAINEEILAAEFYTALAAKMKHKHIKETFEQYALEEMGHRAKLEAIKNGKRDNFSDAKVADMKIADYLIEVDEDKENMTYQEALIIAMKKEKSAFRLYSDLAAAMTGEVEKKLFLNLAQEEAKHKLRFEVEYDDNILTEN